MSYEMTTELVEHEKGPPTDIKARAIRAYASATERDAADKAKRRSVAIVSRKKFIVEKLARIGITDADIYCETNGDDDAARPYATFQGMTFYCTTDGSLLLQGEACDRCGERTLSYALHSLADLGCALSSPDNRQYHECVKVGTAALATPVPSPIDEMHTISDAIKTADLSSLTAHERLRIARQDIATLKARVAISVEIDNDGQRGGPLSTAEKRAAEAERRLGEVVSYQTLVRSTDELEAALRTASIETEALRREWTLRRLEIELSLGLRG